MESLTKSETAIGVLLLEIPEEKDRKPKFDPNTPGYVSGNKTFDFPLKTEAVQGVSRRTWVLDGNPKLAPHFIEAAKKLEQQGVKGITSTCGFTALVQREISTAVSIPVFTSSLLLVPLVYRMLGENQKVGILTRHSRALTEKHFNGAGWSSKDIPISVAGVEEIDSWQTWEKEEYDLKQMGTDLVQRAKEFVQREPSIGAIVLECAVFPIYADSIRETTGLPVFDITTLTRMVYEGVKKTKKGRGFEPPTP